MKTDITTKVYMQTGEGDALKKSITSEDAFNEKVSEAKDANTPAPILLASQAFTLNYAETLEEALALSGGDESIAVAHFNYGSVLRQHKASTDMLTDEAFVAQEGSVDLAFSVAQKVERKKMTNEEKAAKELGINLDDLKAAMALLQAQKAASVSA